MTFGQTAYVQGFTILTGTKILMFPVIPSIL